MLKSSLRKKTPRKLEQQHFLVKRSSIANVGFGLFSFTLIEKNDIIGEYKGEILSDKQSDEEPYVSSKYLLFVCKDYWIYGEGKKSNYTRYINHDGQNPNTRLVISNRWKTARFVANRSIYFGEEIFFDYGDEYWEAAGFEPMRF